MKKFLKTMMRDDANVENSGSSVVGGDNFYCDPDDSTTNADALKGSGKIEEDDIRRGMVPQRGIEPLT